MRRVAPEPRRTKQEPGRFDKSELERAMHSIRGAFRSLDLADTRLGRQAGHAKEKLLLHIIQNQKRCSDNHPRKEAVPKAKPADQGHSAGDEKMGRIRSSCASNCVNHDVSWHSGSSSDQSFRSISSHTSTELRLFVDLGLLADADLAAHRPRNVRKKTIFIRAASRQRKLDSEHRRRRHPDFDEEFDDSERFGAEPDRSPQNTAIEKDIPKSITAKIKFFVTNRPFSAGKVAAVGVPWRRHTEDGRPVSASPGVREGRVVGDKIDAVLRAPRAFGSPRRHKARTTPKAHFHGIAIDGKHWEAQSRWMLSTEDEVR